MVLTGTEADIINKVAKLKRATNHQISKEVGITLEYAGIICRYLIRKGYLVFDQGCYSLAKEQVKTLLQEGPGIDRDLLKEVATEVVKGISGELKKVAGNIKIPATPVSYELGQTPGEQLKIRTDFDFSLDDESLALESNIDKIGASLERKKSDIEKSVNLLKEIQKKGSKT